MPASSLLPIVTRWRSWAEKSIRVFYYGSLEQRSFLPLAPWHWRSAFNILFSNILLHVSSDSLRIVRRAEFDTFPVSITSFKDKRRLLFTRRLNAYPKINIGGKLPDILMGRWISSLSQEFSNQPASNEIPFSVFQFHLPWTASGADSNYIDICPQSGSNESSVDSPVLRPESKNKYLTEHLLHWLHQIPNSMEKI